MKKIFTLFLLLLVVTTGAKAEKWTPADGDELMELVGTVNELGEPIIPGTAASGDTIMLAAGTCDLSATMEIPANKSLTIIGAGADKTIIDGGWSGGTATDGVRIFNLTNASASLTLEGVTLQRGNSSYGGAIANISATVTLKDCILKENYATGTGVGAGGGAIYSYGNLIVINCALIDNQATYLGGAILIAGNTSLIINTTITGNQTNYSGGGLSTYGSGEATVLNSIIVGNTLDDGRASDIYNINTIDMAYSAYGDYKDGDGAGTLNEAEGTNHSGITAEDTFANLGNSLELLEGSDAATGGTMTAYDGTDGYFYDKSIPQPSSLRSAEPRGWISSEGNSVEAPDEKYLLTPLGNTIMGAVFELSDPDPGVHHELTFLVDEGIRINPDKTGYHIEEGHDYTFYMYMNAGFDQKKPYVTVNGQSVSIRETQDGTGWVYRIPAVYEDKMIEIVLQDLTDNLNPEEAGITIYSSAGALIVDVAQSTSVTIYNITGQAVAQQTVDNRAAFNLPKGVYIIKTDKGTTKAVVR